MHTHRTRGPCNIPLLYTCSHSLPLSFSPTHTLAYSESVKHQGEVYSDCGQMSHLGIRQHQSCCQYRTAEPFILPTREGCRCMCAWWKACIYLFTGAENKKYVFESDKIHLLFHVPELQYIPYFSIKNSTVISLSPTAFILWKPFLEMVNIWEVSFSF